MHRADISWAKTTNQNVSMQIQRRQLLMWQLYLQGKKLKLTQTESFQPHSTSP